MITSDGAATGRTVGEIARLAGVSVRTLHHYDHVGLLRPSGRTTAGYRLYTDDDLGVLRRILFYRELEFPLDQIALMLGDAGDTAEDHLRRQHRLLRDQIERRRRLLTALETEMEARRMGISLTPEEQFEIFGTDRVGGEWADEAEQRWGDTEAWKQSQRRTAAYDKDDWVAIKAEGDAIMVRLADAMRAGEPADGPRARAAAEEHRQHICRWFYDCGYDIHRGIGGLQASDPRFAGSWGDVPDGFGDYLRNAFAANADAHT